MEAVVEVEVLGSDGDNDGNYAIEGWETIEPMVSYSEPLALLHKLAYVDGTSSEDIDILFLNVVIHRWLRFRQIHILFIFQHFESYTTPIFKEPFYIDKIKSIFLLLFQKDP